VAERERFVEQMESLDPTQLVYLDESGVNPSLCRAYGWAPVGEKPYLVQNKRGKNTTLIGAIALDGTRALTTISGYLNGGRFVDFLSNDLGPNLRKGDIVIMDGPSVHRVAGVEQALAEFGATALYLPPYSPEFNPIEMCWAYVKTIIRRYAPRTRPKLVEVIKLAWAAVTTALCEGWVRHSGYAVPSST
jgi:transposase